MLRASTWRDIGIGVTAAEAAQMRKPRRSGAFQSTSSREDRHSGACPRVGAYMSMPPMPPMPPAGP